MHARRLGNRGLLAGFNSWRETAQWQALNREKVGRSVKRLLNRQLSSAFSGWASFVEWQLRMTSILMRFIHARQAAALSGWHDAVAHAVQNREMVQGALR